MSRVPVEPIFVDRKTAAARIMISVDTFDTWLQAGFIPRPDIDRGQIVRWHWPSLEQKLAGLGRDAPETDPYMEKVAEVFGEGRRGRARERELSPAAAEMAKQYEAAVAKWRVDILSAPLSKREQDSLRQFRDVPMGQAVSWDSVKGMGVATAESLEARRLIESPGSPPGYWRLTPAGATAVAALTEETK